MDLLQGEVGRDAVRERSAAIKSRAFVVSVAEFRLGNAVSFSGFPLVASTGVSMTMNWEAHIVQDPKVCAGEPVFRGTRVTLRTVLASLAEGSGVHEILRDFPSLSEENVRAAIAFAAASAGDDFPA